MTGSGPASQADETSVRRARMGRERDQNEVVEAARGSPKRAPHGHGVGVPSSSVLRPRRRGSAGSSPVPGRDLLALTDEAVPVLRAAWELSPAEVAAQQGVDPATGLDQDTSKVRRLVRRRATTRIQPR
jgi:hypothetical protein